MLVKNILAVFAIAGMTAAYPAEDYAIEDYEFEARDVLEERGSCWKEDHSWCCKNSLPISIFFFTGAGSDCKPGYNNPCTGNTSPLCCPYGQIVSNGNKGAQVLCLKK